MKTLKDLQIGDKFNFAYQRGDFKLISIDGKFARVMPHGKLQSIVVIANRQIK